MVSKKNSEKIPKKAHIAIWTKTLSLLGVLLINAIFWLTGTLNKNTLKKKNAMTVFKKAMSCGLKPLCISSLLITPIDAFKAAAQSANRVPIIRLFTLIILPEFYACSLHYFFKEYSTKITS